MKTTGIATQVSNEMGTTSIVILGIITGFVLIYLGALFLNAIFNKEE